jgi:hypothetical protein
MSIEKVYNKWIELEKKVDILWKRAQEADRLNSLPFGHVDGCICEECWEKKCE